ncbi:aquaporin-like protein [Cystobasidium minutum MCA 4210]|uniref:aquaporin-like protein n=1 Tax=Cystobasidium minutum MCA 4210 TaxID=1397322 RepID=UPI0034CDE18F|eukprot:jgi/Rhomi1/158261/estExt_Genewise1Plus.C_2_t20455
MAHQRGHRERGDLEVGVADVFMRHPTPHVAPRPELPGWLLRWEDRRPRWLMECIAEAVGVFIYCYGGMGSTAAFFVTAAAKEEGFGNLLSVGLCYGLAIALAIVICGPVSGPHLNPCFTIAFALFKGFPWRKVPQYIISQIFGGFIAGLLVYVNYKQPLDTITDALKAAGLEAQIFTPQGPAFPLALFKGVNQSIGYVFVNEFVGAFVIAVLVFSVLDPSNVFASPTTAPLLLGSAYFVIITAFSVQSTALNTARDLGGRFAAGVIWGRGAFPADYTALAALTNILATICGAAFQFFIMADSTRPAVHLPPASPAVTTTDLPPAGQGYEKHGHMHMKGHETAHSETS